MADFSADVTPYNTVSMGVEGGPLGSTSSAVYNVIHVDSASGLAYIPYGEIGSIFYFKMRAFRNPLGTGFVSWTVITNPDPDGNEAPEAIVPGSAVIMASWIG